MPGPDAIENAFVAKAKAIAGLKDALDHEPEKLPAQPCVTLLFTEIQQDDRYTGPATENWWAWDVNLYISLGEKRANYRDAQAQLKALVPELLRIVRNDPSLNGTALRAEITDPGEAPAFDHRQRLMLKILRLRALTEET